MNRRIWTLVMLATLMLASFATAAEDPREKALQNAADTLTQGCRQEIDSYCTAVAPGKGRVLACLYAFGDKLSPQCEAALYESVEQLEWSIDVLAFVAGECREDLQAYCAGVAPGEGRLLDCIERNLGKVSARCTGAIREVGLHQD